MTAMRPKGEKKLAYDYAELPNDMAEVLQKTCRANRVSTESDRSRNRSEAFRHGQFSP
jgi:hypothetical protein